MSWLLLNWKLVVIGVLCAALAGMTNLYLGKRDQLAALTGTVQALGKAAEDALVEKIQDGKDNLVQVRKDHEAKIPDIRANAVANYRAARRVSDQPSSSSTVRSDGPGVGVDDGAERQCVLDDALIENAAEDAEKLDAWHEYCQRNNCPIVE